MSIDEVYKLVRYLVNKNQGGYLTPEEFNRVINAAQREYFNCLTSDTKYRNMPIPKTSIKTTSGVSESLQPFIKNTTLSAPSGVGTIPVDLYRLLSMRTSTDLMIREVDWDKWYGWVNSTIDTPSTTNPIFAKVEDGYEFLPITLTGIKITYLRKPAEMVWAYTTPSGRPVYNSGSSVQPEWNETELNDIILIACDMIGVNLRDGELIKAAEVIKND